MVDNEPTQKPAGFQLYACPPQEGSLKSTMINIVVYHVQRVLAIEYEFVVTIFSKKEGKQMRRRNLLITAMCLMLSIGIIGCMSSAYISQKRIVKSKEYTTAEEQVKYLIGEANTLIKMEEYDAAINIAQYILKDLDPNSAEANDVIKTAKAGQEEAAKYRARYDYYRSGIGGFHSRGLLYHGHHHHGFHHHGSRGPCK